MYTLNNTKSAYAGSKKWTAYEPKSVNSKVIAVGSNMKFFRYKEIDFWLGIATSINAPYNVQKSLSKHSLKNQISKNALIWIMNAESQLCRNSSTADLVILGGSIHSKISEIKTVFSTQRHFLEFLKTLYHGENIVFISTMSPLEIISDPYAIASIMKCAITHKRAGFDHVYEDIQYGSDLVISTTCHVFWSGWFLCFVNFQHGHAFVQVFHIRILYHTALFVITFLFFPFKRILGRWA